MQFRISRWIVAVFALGVTAAFAESALAPPPWPATHGAETPAAGDPVHPLKIGPVRVVLDLTTLAEVQRAVGAGQVIHQGKGSEALDWLCYTIADVEPGQRVWLASSELAGGSRIDGITAIELAPGDRAPATCPELPARFRPIRFEDGLWIGVLGAELRRALGLTPKASGAWASTFHGQRGTVDVVSSLVLDIRKTRAVALYLARGGQN